MSDRFNMPPNWQGMFSQVVREIQNGLSKLETTVNNATEGQRVPIDDEDIAVPTDQPKSWPSTPKASTYHGPKWEYKVVYINFKGQISSEGEQVLIGRGERRSSFVRKFLDEVGAEGWELTGVSPLADSENSYFIFKRHYTGEAKTVPADAPAVEKIEVEEMPGDQGSTI